jgi:hypothetical protein
MPCSIRRNRLQSSRTQRSVCTSTPSSIKGVDSPPSSPDYINLLVYYSVIDPVNSSPTYVLVVPGASASYTFTDQTNAQDGPATWDVWSAIPQNTTATWLNPTTSSPPNANTLTFQTEPTTPTGETAVGIDMQYPTPLCRQSELNAANVLIDVENPLATAAESELAGDFTQSASGAVALSSSSPSQIADLTLGGSATGVRSSGRIVRESELVHANSLPAGYSTAPPNLPENSTEVADFAALVTALPDPLPACFGYLQEQRANASNVQDAMNPAYFQIQTYCENGASIASGSIVSSWQGTGYNGSAPVTLNVQQSCTDSGTDNLGLEKCFTPVDLLPLASGHAELNEPTELSYSVTAMGITFTYDPLYFGQTSMFYLNNRSVPYPVVQVQPSWGPSSSMIDGAVRPPINPPYTRTAKGCGDNTKGPSDALGKALSAAGYPYPGTGYNAHHIKPSCWGGNNLVGNGIWLPTTASGEPNLHQPFSTWFSPNGNFTP